ncbi:hypothetical protein H206_03532 [Candidatus Electrothrix aarhusensis]|uniref:Uncharacterized protein n=1 Tax=Candidatus Electrothrix aarhusensis TaxID=1859131 RepID=A0A3S3SNV9_9BACT|nr:hypothetical protein H206_03532 [Candidatus Electrothrix aarhusensis]
MLNVGNGYYYDGFMPVLDVRTVITKQWNT